MPQRYLNGTSRDSFFYAQRRNSDWIHRDVLSLAIDESNHGQFPEIYSGVLSKIKNDAVKSPTKLDKAKKEKDFQNIVSEVNQRDYFFLVVASKEDYKRIGYNEMTGVVAASLLNETDFNFEFLRIMVNGEPSAKGKDYVVGFVSEYLRINPNSVILKCGKDLDIKYQLVNLADGMARHLHRQKLEDIAQNPNIKYLVK
ncbi:MAG: hypothetical protein AABX93_03530 [Nanoarchaeota archaeon]